MLSLNKLIVGSWRTSRHVTNAARKSLSVILARSYMAGRNWVAAQGLQMKNNAAELPSSAPFIYPTRKGRCGVIVFHPTSNVQGVNESACKQLEDNLLLHEANEKLGTLVLLCTENATLHGTDYKGCFGNAKDSVTNQRLLTLKRREYATINQVHISALPVLAIMNGTFLTSAASLFLNARFPIITESTSLRFHSAQLGFFPDAGATKLLSSLGGLGMYLGLSGSELSGHSLVHFGLSPWFIENEALEAFINDMSQNASRNRETLQERLAQNAMPLQPLEREAMDRYSEAARLFNPCFYQDQSPLDLLQRLEKDGSEFAKTALQELTAGKSAFSMMLTWTAIRDACKRSLHGTLKRDLHVWSNVLRSRSDRSFLRMLRTQRPMGQTLDPAELTSDLQQEVEELLRPDPTVEFDLDKIHHFEMPMLRGDCFGNEEFMKVVPEDVYDWDRVDEDTYYLVHEEDDCNPRKRAFRHPVTGIMHPVPQEWMDEMRVAEETRKRQREQQIRYEGEMVLSRVTKSRYEK